MSRNQNFEIAHMLCSRICHDLVAPAGAFQSGIELLQEQAHSDGQEIIDMLEQSSASVARRLAFFRYAFGHGATNSMTSLEQLREILESFLDSGKFSLQWKIISEATVPAEELRLWAKLLANMVLLMVESAPYGGTITISVNQPQGDFYVELDSSRILMQEQTKKLLSGQGDEIELSPRVIQPYLTKCLADDLNKNLIFSQPSEGKLLFMTKRKTSAAEMAQI